MGKFLTKLHVELLDAKTEAGEDLFQLLEPLIYESNTVGIIIVPRGFVTDFASVPRVPIAYMLAGGVAKEAAVLHDFLYTFPHNTGTGRTVTRPESDCVLRGAGIEGMRLPGDEFIAAVCNQIKFCVPRLMWVMVRLFGWSHWGKERKVRSTASNR